MYSFSVVTTRTANKPQSMGTTTGAGPMPPKRLSQTGDWFYLGEIAKAGQNIENKKDPGNTGVPFE
jgi:hypothetical protein